MQTLFEIMFKRIIIMLKAMLKIIPMKMMKVMITVHHGQSSSSGGGRRLPLKERPNLSELQTDGENFSRWVMTVMMVMTVMIVMTRLIVMFLRTI